MRIALLGYGKMGKEIEKIALERGHEISLKVSSSNKDFQAEDLSSTDVAIEFSRPEFARDNIKKCFKANVPIVVGTTGWYDHFDELTQQCLEGKKSLFHATNFSIGVNLFFQINKKLAELMNSQENYEVGMTEIHHTQKLDAPSGTGITLAEGILENLDRKNSWVGDKENPEKNEVNIISERVPEVPGTHIINYSSEIDDIEIKHTAHNRKGFALGSVLAAEWLKNKTGVFSMKDMLQF